VQPKPEDTLGDYYEKYSVVSDKKEYILSIEIGKIAKSDIPFHQKMWDRAISIIKELAEKE
jgi:hypothetical protein